MSYNEDPKWTTNLVLPDQSLMTCPTCGLVAFNAEQVMNCLYALDYYHPRHIPPALTFTCDNADCPDCGRDFVFELSATVMITSSPYAEMTSLCRFFRRTWGCHPYGLRKVSY
jgi:hypothetical protein